jgi:hypothetical protein
LNNIYIYCNRLQKSKNGELNESAERQQMVETIKHLKQAQEIDSKSIEKLTGMVEQLLLSHKGKHDIIIIVFLISIKFVHILFMSYLILINYFFRRDRVSKTEFRKKES